MEKLNKKKVILVIILALLVIAGIILGVIFLGKTENADSESGTISMSESEFESLKIKNIELTYKDDGAETIIDFAIENTTDEKVEKQTINIQLLGENDVQIAKVETYIETIDENSSHKVNMMLAGNIQGIKKIKLVKPEQQQ